jgi:hypothetical protein
MVMIGISVGWGAGLDKIIRGARGLMEPGVWSMEHFQGQTRAIVVSVYYTPSILTPTTQNKAFQRLAARDPESSHALVEEIVGKAQGVFIWVALVVQSLLRGIRNRDELSDLWDRLRLFPKELEPLYARLLEMIEPVYLPWAVKAFQLLRINHKIVNSEAEELMSDTSGLKHLTICTFSRLSAKSINPSCKTGLS